MSGYGFNRTLRGKASGGQGRGDGMENRVRPEGARTRLAAAGVSTKKRRASPSFSCVTGKLLHTPPTLWKGHNVHCRGGCHARPFFR